MSVTPSIAVRRVAQVLENHKDLKAQDMNAQDLNAQDLNANGPAIAGAIGGAKSGVAP